MSLSFLSSLPPQQDLPLPVHYRNNTNTKQLNNTNNTNNNAKINNSKDVLLDESVFSQPLSNALLTNEHTALLCVRSDLHILYTWLGRLKQLPATKLTSAQPSTQEPALSPSVTRSYIAGLQNLQSELFSYWEIEQRVLFPLIRDLHTNSNSNNRNTAAFNKMSEIVNNLQYLQQNIKYQINDFKFQKEFKIDKIFYNILNPLETYLNSISNELLPLLEHNLFSSELEEMTRNYLKVHGEVYRKCVNDHKCMPNERHKQPFRNYKHPFQAKQPGSVASLSVAPLSSKL